MSIKKSLLALAVAALASMAFASSAMAGGGTVVDTPAGTPMVKGERVHYQGWAKFTGNLGSLECHVTSETEAIDDVTGTVTKFTVPDTNKCTGTGSFSSCKLASHESNEPTVTARANDFDVTGVQIKNTFSGCNVTKVTLTFNSLTLQPFATGDRQPTGTAGANLGGTAAPGDPIAGVEISGSGNAHSEQHIIFVPTTLNSAVHVAGELEVTNGTAAGNDRCTWTLAA